jgi:predicted transcriptional regulator
MNEELLALTADIVSAHVSNNKVGTGDVATLIRNVHDALAKLGEPAEVVAPKAEPAVSIRSSVKHDYIVCLEDGKKMKMLKRYLRRNYDMSPEEYRTKWGLPRDYPMVAPAYAEQRRDLAKVIGLGKGGRKHLADGARTASTSTKSLAAARQHLGSAEKKPAVKPRAK